MGFKPFRVCVPCKKHLMDGRYNKGPVGLGFSSGLGLQCPNLPEAETTATIVHGDASTSRKHGGENIPSAGASVSGMPTDFRRMEQRGSRSTGSGGNS
jgi:hypothetical protein